MNKFKRGLFVVFMLSLIVTKGTTDPCDDYFTISLNGLSGEFIPASVGPMYPGETLCGKPMPTYVDYNTKAGVLPGSGKLFSELIGVRMV